MMCGCCSRTSYLHIDFLDNHQLQSGSQTHGRRTFVNEEFSYGVSLFVIPNIVITSFCYQQLLDIYCDIVLVSAGILANQLHTLAQYSRKI